MTQNANGDASPPDGYRTPDSDSPMERLGMIEGALHDLGARIVTGDLARNSQFASLSKAIAAEAEAARIARAEDRETAAHLAEGLMAACGSIGETRQEVRGVSRALSRLGEDVADTKASLMGEMSLVRQEIRALHRSDSMQDITLVEHTGALKAQTSALARVGAQVTWVNAFKATVVGCVTALAAHPGAVVDAVAKVLGRLFG